MTTWHAPRTALPTLFAIALTSGACGDDSTGSGGGGGGDASTTGAQGSTSASGSGSAAASTSGSSVTAASSSSGGAQNPSPCDPIEQDCVEPDAGKCGYWFSSQSFECTEVIGDAEDGEPCAYPDDAGGGDTCGPGFFCTNDGQPSADERACASYCDEATPCAEGKACGSFGDASQPGLCLFACEIFGECARPELGCYQYVGQGDSLILACAPAGDAAPYAPCANNDECQKDATCLVLDGERTAACVPLCDEAHPCEAEATSCQALEIPGSPLDGQGACLPG